jgi:FkbM family methyltransferase
VSFEPMRREYADLETRAAADDRWLTRPVALGDAATVTSINVAANSISSSLLPMLDTHADAAPNSRYVDVEQVEVQRLEDLFEELVSPGERVFLKVDTQGFEHQVLAGASAVMPRVHGMQIEMSLVALYGEQMLLSETLEAANGYGMTLWETERTFTSPDGRLLQLDGIFFREE